jgi:hypothetical protein
MVDGVSDWRRQVIFWFFIGIDAQANNPQYSNQAIQP